MTINKQLNNPGESRLSVCYVIKWTLLRIHFHKNHNSQASLVAQTVKRLSAMQETRVRSLGWEDPLEKETAAHSSILAWGMLWTEEPGRI